MLTEDTTYVWDTCLKEIESQISKAHLITWFKETHFIRDDEGTIFIGVPNDFVRDWMIQKYQKIILRSLMNIIEHARAVEFVVDPAKQKDGEQKVMGSGQTLPLGEVYINRDDNLNPRYTFDRFVVGPFNELAYAAAQALIKRPTQAYNPLFIYGGSGLGKTHLIQGIGNEMKHLFPEKKVLYISSEKFMNDYINSVQHNKSMAFRDRYRKIDVLIIDDVQFISGKDKTQEELFHLFNTLYEQQKNIIFSSDKHPNHILGLEDRLKTRFGAGMIIDIQEPDLESRMAIIREKIQQQHILIDDDAAQYLAQTITSNIREIEGSLNTIAVQNELRQRPITITEVRQLVKNTIKPKKNISVDTVVKIVSDYYNLDNAVIYEKTRRKEIVRARQMIMYVLREDFNESYPSIGMKLGGKDHTTVIHSYEKIKSELGTNPLLIKELEDIRILFK